MRITNHWCRGCGSDIELGEPTLFVGRLAVHRICWDRMNGAEQMKTLDDAREMSRLTQVSER